MTKIYLIPLIICLLTAVYKPINAQDEVLDDQTSNTSELTDGPQTLDAPAAAQTEAIPEITTEKTPLEKKNGPIISEEELLKPLSPVQETKVKAEKINESEIYVQEAEKFKTTEIYKNLRLNDVIEQGLRKNYDQNIRQQTKQLNELAFSGVKRSFWVPELKISLTTSEQRVSTIGSSSAPLTQSTPIVPTGAFGLVLSNYTVFNWGKDYSVYLNNKTSYERNQKALDETRREFRLDLISQYFGLMALKNIEKINLEQLKQASFVYRLNKEKITIGKISKQDYYQARSEYLRSQSEYRTAKMATDTQDENMAFTIADDVGTKYVLTENLNYKRLKISLDECYELSSKNNPSILNSKTLLENANRSYDLALKENLPLPKFTVNLGAYTKRFGPSTNKTVYENSSSGGNMEIVASVNASWSLTGSDGLFNSDKMAISYINKELSAKDLEKNNHLSKSFIRQSYNNILSLQNQVLIQEARIPSLQKTFDTVLENYLNNKTKYYDFHLVLYELTQTKILLEETKLLHLREKLALAKYSGVEDFPGENFERMAESKKEQK